MQAVADLCEIKLFTLLSFAHGAIDLLEKLSAFILVLCLQEAQKRREGNHFESKSISLAKEHALCGRYEHSDDPGRINIIDSSGRFHSALQLHVQPQ